MSLYTSVEIQLLPEMLCADVQIADQAKVQGQEGKIRLGGGLQH